MTETKSLNVAILGLGYVGFTAACCIASEGHSVIGVDVSDAKIDDITRGIPPFEEPGLAELMAPSVAAGRLRATKSVMDALRDADLAIVCVGTPSGPNGAHDMRYIVDVSRQIAEAMAAMPDKRLTVSYRSTMRPGTTRQLIAPIFQAKMGPDWQARTELVYNPEFLREASAIHDYFHPPKIIIGTRDAAPSQVMTELHAGIDAPVFHVAYEEAEITKFVDNSWHAVKVAFANEVGRVCEKLGIRAAKVHEIFVSDTKLNISPYYMRPGGAFGGSCLPKDVRAFSYIANDLNAAPHLIDSLIRSNEAHKHHQFESVLRHLPSDRPARVLMAGLAFKAGTDDLRESPNVDLARKLLEAGHLLRIFDPNLDPSRLRGQNLGVVYTALPTIDQLLVDQDTANKEEWDLVVVNNATGKLLSLDGRAVVNTSAIA